MFSNLIDELFRKYNAEVVVLIDEYDVPVSDNLDDIALAEANAKVLKDFYSRLKDCQENLRFVFVTGVTRFAMMGLSSGLNHLDDLTFDDNFSTICGFTLEELDGCFKEHLPLVLQKLKNDGISPENYSMEDLRENILKWYDGYSWDGKTRVLNPWSILNFFKTASFSNYWVTSGPSTVSYFDCQRRPIHSPK
jgi:hypothetical protein